jgi:hypothetical protein
MFNYRLKYINVYSVFKYVTILSLIIGGVWGLFLGLLARDLVGIPGGLFFGFIFGLFNGIVASLYTFLFNLFASSIGGIEIQLERKDAFLDSLHQPLPLVNEPIVPQIMAEEQEHISKSDVMQ